MQNRSIPKKISADLGESSWVLSNKYIPTRTNIFSKNITISSLTLLDQSHSRLPPRNISTMRPLLANGSILSLHTLPLTNNFQMRHEEE